MSRLLETRSSLGEVMITLAETGQHREVGEEGREKAFLAEGRQMGADWYQKGDGPSHGSTS